MKRFLLVFGILVIGLAGCASTTPNIVVSAGPPVDITEINTFAYLKPLGTDRGGGSNFQYGSRSQFSTRLISAMNREASRRRVRQSATPDVIMDFNLFAPGQIVFKTDESGVSTVQHPHWKRAYTVWDGYEERMSAYTQGTLLIHFLEPKTGRLLGEGSAAGLNTSNVDKTNMPQKEINFIVGRTVTEMIKARNPED